MTISINIFQSRNIGIINASITGMSLLTSVGSPDWHPASKEIKDAAKEAAQLCKVWRYSHTESRPSILHAHEKCI